MAKPIILVTGRDPYGAAGGGTTYYVRVHARGALHAGYEPHVFCLDSRDEVVESDFGYIHRVATPYRPFGPLAISPREQAHKFAHHWLNALIFTPLMVGLHKGVLARSIEKFIGRRAGPHIIHGFYTWGCVGLDLRKRLPGSRIHVISSVYTTAEDEIGAKRRGLGQEADWRKRLLYDLEFGWTRVGVTPYERRAYRESDLVTANYASVERQFLAQYGRGAEFRLLPYTSDTAFLQGSGQGAFDTVSEMPREISALKESGVPLIVTVSRHDPRKGLDIFLRALEQVRSAGVDFRACLVSGGPLLDMHRRLATQLGIDDVTVMTGWVKDSYAYLRHADIFVLPSTQEGSGSLAMIEALQAGAAVVASGIDGIPEDVTDGESALLVPSGDVEALARALARVLTDGDLRARLKQGARRKFEERFSPDAFARALGEVYARFCNGGGTNGAC